MWGTFFLKKITDNSFVLDHAPADEALGGMLFHHGASEGLGVSAALVVAGGGAELLLEAGGEVAGGAEAGHVGYLADGVLAFA